jgi:hypothetical protein
MAPPQVAAPPEGLVAAEQGDKMTIRQRDSRGPAAGNEALAAKPVGEMAAWDKVWPWRYGRLSCDPYLSR